MIYVKMTVSFTHSYASSRPQGPTNPRRKIVKQYT